MALIIIIGRLVRTAFRDAVPTVGTEIVLADAGMTVFRRLEARVAQALLGVRVIFHCYESRVGAALLHTSFPVYPEELAHAGLLIRKQSVVGQTHTLSGFFVSGRGDCGLVAPAGVRARFLVQRRQTAHASAIIIII